MEKKKGDEDWDLGVAAAVAAACTRLGGSGKRKGEIQERAGAAAAVCTSTTVVVAVGLAVTKYNRAVRRKTGEHGRQADPSIHQRLGSDRRCELRSEAWQAS